MENLQLEIGKEYPVELYPKDDKVSARYIGKSNGTHVFANDEQYVFVDDSWITREGETITHNSFSSFSVISLSRVNLKNVPKKASGLINILKELGEEV